MRRYCVVVLLVLFPGSLAAQTTADGILAIGRGDFETAARILSPLAENPDNPDPLAAFFLASLYYSGTGVPSVLGNWTRACGLYLKAARAGSPVRTQAETLIHAIDGGHPLMHAECEAVSELPWVMPPVTTITLAPGHRVLIGPETLAVEYDGQIKASSITLGGAGVVYLPVRHTSLSGPSPQEWRRDFVEFFLWLPGRSGEPPWSLTWWVYEIVGLEVVPVNVDHLLTTSTAFQPPRDRALSDRASIIVGPDGDAEWRISGPEPKGGHIPQGVR